MFIVAVPLVLVLFVAIGIGAGINQALQVNIMPAVSLLCAIFAIVGIVKSFSCEESQRNAHIVLAVISGILFLLTIGSSLSSGDILSWIWYHI